MNCCLRLFPLPWNSVSCGATPRGRGRRVLAGRGGGGTRNRPCPVLETGCTDRSVALAPVAVAEDRRRRGVAAALIEAGLEKAMKEGWAAVVVLGDPSYYPRFGFSQDAVRGISCQYAGPRSDGAGFRRGRLRGTTHRICVRVLIDLGIELRHRRSLSEFHRGLAEPLTRGTVASWVTGRLVLVWPPGGNRSRCNSAS